MKENNDRAIGLKELLGHFPEVDADAVLFTASKYPAKINAYYKSLLDKPNSPLWRQVVPDPVELEDNSKWDDPLAEDTYSPVPGLVHRYPDRVLLLVSADCPVYCRFCTRKRRIRTNIEQFDAEKFTEAFHYIETHPEIKDVLISGGDPLMLSDDDLAVVLSRLSQISHVALVRIGTRALCTWPERVTDTTVEMLRTFSPLFINTHFNHPAELTAQAKETCTRLVEAGIQVANQTVLLRGVNDDPEVLEELFWGLLQLRVKPYYLHMMDLTRGTAHFRVNLHRAQQIYAQLQGRMSGMALPRLMLDLPGGGGKVPVNSSYIVQKCDDGYMINNYEGKRYYYPECDE